MHLAQTSVSLSEDQPAPCLAVPIWVRRLKMDNSEVPTVEANANELHTFPLISI